ncbi:hypothetical protein PPSIR1_03063 [Plesiocystis pacifica SIR-1]|uniref:Uncharacterized protein n=1 Tax=Plesiocystis pacifica SIR-1 TaxID=391625 RepID=A6G983_9BACT|nr:hypothetical protein [Plesiocystis pacifica]EDM77631.1 hypothetical protein PPSIR1_03063 [Plesiocystis pacifica SIR-1]
MVQAPVTELRSILPVLVSVTLLAASTPVQAGQGAPEADAPAEQPEPETLDVDPTVAEVEEPEQDPGNRGGGVAGSIVDPDDPNASRAQSDLEGESLDDNVAGVPERLPKLQTAGWWTTFGAIALATTGGVLAGVAEAREDEAERLAFGFDIESGTSNLYADVADDYDQVLQEGRTYEAAARGLIIAGGVTLLVGVGLFIADGVQRKRGEAKPGAGEAKLQFEPGAGGLRLRF